MNGMDLYKKKENKVNYKVSGDFSALMFAQMQ